MKRLSSLKTDEVSLVGKGANKKKFLIYKNSEGKPMPTPAQEIQNLINKVDPKVMANVEKVVKGMKIKKFEAEEGKDKAEKEHGSDMLPGKDSAAHKDGAGAGLSDRAQAALKAVARIIAPFKDELSDDHMDAVQDAVGIHSDKTEDGVGKDHMAAIPEGVSDEHHAEALDMAKKAYGAHLEKMGYRKYPDQQPENTNKSKHGLEDDDDDDEDGEDDVDKSAVTKSASLDLSAFPEKQRGQLELIFKANNELAEKNKELVQKADKLEKAIADRDAKDEHREIVQKAEEFTHLGLPKEEIIEQLKDAKKMGEKSYARVCKSFETLNVQSKESGLFKELGSRQGGTGVGDAEAKLERLVDTVVQKSEGGMSRAAIYDEVLKTDEGKKLYAEMKRNRPGGI